MTIYLNKNLIHLRKQKGWTQHLTATLLGIPLKRYQAYEYEYATPPPIMLVKMAGLLEVDLTKLLVEPLYRQGG